MLRTMVLLVAALALAPGASAEQRPEPLAPGARVRVSSSALPSSPIQGDAVTIGGGALTFRPVNRESVLTVQAGRIERLEIRGRAHGHAGNGALVGGALGTLLGLVGAVVAISDPFASGDSGSNAFGAIMLTAMGALVGAGGGAILGSAVITRDWVDLPPDQLREAFARAAADSIAAAPRPEVKH